MSLKSQAFALLLLLASPATHAWTFPHQASSVLEHVASALGNRGGEDAEFELVYWGEVLGSLFDGLQNFQPSGTRLLDQLMALRRGRGDREGAQRLAELKAWFSFTGLNKGLPAIFLDLYKAKSKLQEPVLLAKTVYAEIARRASEVGWPQALVESRTAVSKAAKKLVRKLRDAVPVGAARSFVKDVVQELRLDPQLGPDLMRILLGSEDGGRGKSLLAVIQDCIAAIRSAWEGDPAQQDSTGRQWREEL